MKDKWDQIKGVRVLPVCSWERARVCQVQWWAVGTVTQVTVRRGPLPWLALATDGYAMVFRRLSSPSLSDAHMHIHTFCTHGGTQLAHHHILCFLFSLQCAHTHSRQPPSLLFRCVRGLCVQPSSLIMSVCSVLVCVNCLLLAGPSVLWLQSWWWLLSCLSSLLPPLLWSPLSLTEAK